MNFNYPTEAEAFRRELRAWLEANRALAPEPAARGLDHSREEAAELQAWNRVMADAGYGAVAWPVEYGGRGASLLEQVVFAEEMSRLDLPGNINVIGVANIAPAIMQWGSEAQKRRFLPRMLRAEEIWCQGMSEPDAGSDLASLQCRATLDGDVFTISGQKTWNSLGNLADWCQLYVRTDPTAAKHRGISCLLVDMSLPGIEVRPLTTITGSSDFSELFFTDVRVPRDSLLGPLNGGWKVATTTLAYERAGVAILHLDTRRRIRAALDAAAHVVLPDGRAATDDPVLRQRLASVYLEGECLKLLSDRAVSGQLHGRETGPEGSLAKLLWSDASQHLAELQLEIHGHAGMTLPGGMEPVASRGSSIAGGTTQINKNIIAQRVLGLPRSK
ncbi:MAG: acyl-CoA dehydrogenase family protein [Acidimicrobiales bacterium]